MDEALALPTEDAARVALRTQQVIAFESGVADTVDPLAGSYAIEQLTTEIEQRVVEYLDKIDALGGTLRAIEQGYIHRSGIDSRQRRSRLSFRPRVDIRSLSSESRAECSPVRSHAASH